jgi:HKD family nuclease
VITADVKSAVNINSSTHGKVESSSSLAQADEQVSITPIPDEGYYLQSISVVGTESGNAVNISGGTFFSPVATFSMPEEAVTVTVEFAKELTAENVSVNMLANGSQEFTLPTVIKSLKIYDNGGKLGGYSSNCNGLFTLNAPSGCRLRFSGSSYFENRWDKLTIFDGTEDGQKLFYSNDLSSSQQDIPTRTTTSNKLTLKITSDGGVEYDGLDLTVTVVGHELTLPQGIVIAEDAEKVDGTYMPGAELTIKADDNYSLSDVKANDETITANTDGTYAITFGGENIEVTAVVKKSLNHADITVASVDDQTYTGSAIEPIVTVFDGDKDITSYCNISFSNNTNVGTAGISIAATAENERYVGSVDATFTISPKAVTVTANDKNVVYGETFTLTATVDGVVGSDEIAYTISREEGENVGEYVITPSGDELQGNYAVTYVAGKLTISPKSVTVTADDKTTAYGAAFTLTATVDGVLGSDEIAYTISREEGENVGEYVITPSGEKLQGNYAVTYVAGKYTILKATPEFEEIKSQVIESTQTLADVTLPEGYSFVNAEQTLNLGENTVALNYNPDPVNYETVSGNMVVIVTKATVTSVQDAQNAKSQNVKKYVENGSLIIEVDGVKYDITGKVVK